MLLEHDIAQITVCFDMWVNVSSICSYNTKKSNIPLSLSYQFSLYVVTRDSTEDDPQIETYSLCYVLL